MHARLFQVHREISMENGWDGKMGICYFMGLYDADGIYGSQRAKNTGKVLGRMFSDRNILQKHHGSGAGGSDFSAGGDFSRHIFSVCSLACRRSDGNGRRIVASFGRDIDRAGDGMGRSNDRSSPGGSFCSSSFDKRKGRKKYKTAVYSLPGGRSAVYRKDLTGSVLNTGGYMTVEAAFILPIAVFILAFLIRVSFYMYDRCTFDQDLYLICYRAGVRKDDDRFEEQIYRNASLQLEGRYLGAEKPVLRAEKTDRIRLQGKTKAMGWPLRSVGEAAHYDPPLEIRTCRRLLYLAGKIKKRGEKR